MNAVHVINESVPGAELRFGNGTVGTSEQKLSAIDWPLLKFVAIQASADNGDTITVGRPGAASAGWILNAGESTPPIPVDNTSKLAVIGGDAGQQYNWLGI